MKTAANHSISVCTQPAARNVQADASSLESNMSWLIILARLVNIIHGGFGVDLPGLLKPVDLGWGDVASSEQLSLCGCDNQPGNKGAILCNALMHLFC